MYVHVHNMITVCKFDDPLPTLIPYMYPPLRHTCTLCYNVHANFKGCLGDNHNTLYPANYHHHNTVINNYYYIIITLSLSFHYIHLYFNVLSNGVTD